MTILILSAILIFSAAAQPPGTNYDEAKVPQYALPDPLVMQNGERVRDAKMWQTRRRPEILRLLETQMFGRSAPKPATLSFELTGIDKQALGGKAVRKQITMLISGKRVPLLLYLPAAARGPVPVFLGLNFTGNHAVNADPGIPLGDVWTPDRERKTTTKRPATEASRGSAAGRWQVEMIVARGYGLATIYYGDLEPDFDGGLPHGVRPLYYKPGQTQPAPDEWGAIGAWAWGLSRALDYLETDKEVDAKRVAVMGHSRLGKTSLWAGAADQRFAMVISNDSGEGGAAISRRQFGETVRNLNDRFPHWFCGNYKQYSGREDAMPFDSHMLLALIAPRPLYVASAEEDQWADPKGEFLATVGASPVFELLGKRGVGTGEMPAVHQPKGDTVRYHVRAGKHDVTAYDWEQYLDFADRQWRR
jgi:hypothetical protein